MKIKKERQNKQTSIEEVTQDKDRKKLDLIIKRFSCNIVVGHTPDFSLLRIE